MTPAPPRGPAEALAAHDRQRRRHILLTMLTTLAIRYPPDHEPELVRLLRGWLDGWSGLARIVLGMTLQGFGLQLTQYDGQGWRATSFRRWL